MTVIQLRCVRFTVVQSYMWLDCTSLPLVEQVTITNTNVSHSTTSLFQTHIFLEFASQFYKVGY